MSRSLRVKIRHWHRKLGVAIALGAVFIVITGLVINHAPQWRLDQPGVYSSWVLDHYGIDVSPAESGWPIEEQWISYCSSRIYLDEQPLFSSPELIKALPLAGFILIASREQLSLISPTGELIEQLGREALPGAIKDLASHDEQVFIHTAQGWYRSDLDLLSWQLAPAPTTGTPSKRPLPPQLAQQIHRQARALELSWERVLLDLHSGRFFGAWGPWVIDAIAIGIALLAFSGFWLWFRAQARHH